MLSALLLSVCVSLSFTATTHPCKKSDAYEVTYGVIPSRSGRLRTIVTRPKTEGKHPALFLIQRIGLASIDNPVGPLSTYKTIVDDFTRRIFVTLRVDKPGCGDSEGGPARDVEFDAELDGYRQALKTLMSRSDVDGDRVFVFGHGMGGLMAPLLAAEVPVRGIIVYGTIARTWTDYRRNHPGHRTFLAMDGIDHGFNRAASRRESFGGRSGRQIEFNSAVLDVCRSWVEKTDALPAAEAKRAG